MESVQERVQKVLERVIRDVVGQEKRYREIIADNDSISATVSKTKSMVALKRERIERARTYKRIVEESQMLPSLVRLADYMISESLVSLVLNNLSDLLSLLANPNKTKGVFLTTVAFAHDLTTFTPNEPEAGTGTRRSLSQRIPAPRVTSCLNSHTTVFISHHRTALHCTTTTKNKTSHVCVTFNRSLNSRAREYTPTNG